MWIMGLRNPAPHIFSLGTEFLLSLPGFLCPESWVSLPCFRKRCRNPQRPLLAFKIAGASFRQGKHLPADHGHSIVLVMWTHMTLAWVLQLFELLIRDGSLNLCLPVSCSHCHKNLVSDDWIRKGIGAPFITRFSPAAIQSRKGWHIFILLCFSCIFFFLIFLSFAFFAFFFNKNLMMEKKDPRVGAETLSHLTGDVIWSSFKSPPEFISWVRKYFTQNQGTEGKFYLLLGQAGLYDEIDHFTFNLKGKRRIEQIF